MKKYITLAALLAAGSLAANATETVTLTELAKMETLMNAATTKTNVEDVSAQYTSGTIYSFNGTDTAYGITNDAISKYITDGEGYLTVAAWINPGNVVEKSVFSFGEQTTGVKFSIKNGGMQITTKDKSDYNKGGSIVENTWTLVAWTLSLDTTKASRVLAGDEYTLDFNAGEWNATTTLEFAIGSGNDNGNRDPYQGLIANLTVFGSDGLASYADISAKIGAKPAIPEPSAFGLLAGLGALALVGTRRRRK